MDARAIFRLATSLLGHPANMPEPRRPQPQRRPRLATDIWSADFIASPAFLQTDEWVRLRYDTIRRYGRRCMACGRTPADGIKINVDHIKPRKTHPHLALDPNNMQVCCHVCNKGKGNRHTDDWRR